MPPPAQASIPGAAPTHESTASTGHSLEDVLLRIDAAVGSKLSLTQVLETILEVSTKEISAQEASILLHDGNLERLAMLASRGLPAEVAERGYISRKGSIAEWVIEHDQPLILNGTVKKAEFESGPKRRTIVSSMCLPLHADDQVIGTLNLNRTDESLGVFHDGDLRIMTLIAGYAASSIAKAQLHEAVLHSERLAVIGQTVSGVAHCIKNMLTSLQGGLSICKIASEREDWGTFKEGTGLLERAVTRVSSLALDMLEYSKDRKPVMMEVPLDEIFKEIIELKTPAAAKHGIELTAETGPGAESVWADGNQLFRCILNLVDNAIDASHGGGSVSLSTRHDNAQGTRRKIPSAPHGVTVIQVADTGGGIPEEIAAKIFDPFFSTKGSKGTGLGLAVTRKIIREHGGEIDMNTVLHESTIFSIYLPAHGGASPAEAK